MPLSHFVYFGAGGGAGSTKGDTVAWWLVRSSGSSGSSPAGEIVLCFWARHLTPTVPLSTQVHKWVPANLMLGVTLR